MLFYYSGTGNSRYVAEMLSRSLDEPLVSITSVDARSVVFTGNTLGFIFPVYSWGVPPIVLAFIKGLNYEFIERINNKDVWMCCSCGDETGKAPQMFIKAFRKRGIDAKGAWSVIMPNNYVLLPGFDVDSLEIRKRKLKEAPARIADIASKVRRGKMEIDVTSGSLPSLRSAVYPLFVRFGISTRKWSVSDACISCGKCVSVCPVHNIRLENGRPSWGKNCLSCCACYHYCQVKAINYGNVTQGKGQYFFNGSD